MYSKNGTYDWLILIGTIEMGLGHVFANAFLPISIVKIGLKGQTWPYSGHLKELFFR